MKYLLIVLSVVFLTGCTTVKSAKVSSITATEKGIEFAAYRPVKMTMEKDGAVYTYDSQAESFITKILSVLTVGMLGRN